VRRVFCEIIFQISCFRRLNEEQERARKLPTVRTYLSFFLASITTLTFALGSGCAGSAEGDATPDAAIDTGPVDAGPKDSGPKDTGPKDTGISCQMVTCTTDEECSGSSSCTVSAGNAACCDQATGSCYINSGVCPEPPPPEPDAGPGY
jgi:hypothetical protein